MKNIGKIRVVSGLMAMALVGALSLTQAGYADEGGQGQGKHHRPTAEQIAALKACVAKAGLPPLPTPPPENTKEDHRAHWKAMKEYREGLSEAQQAQLKACHKNVFGKGATPPAPTDN